MVLQRAISSKQGNETLLRDKDKCISCAEYKNCFKAPPVRLLPNDCDGLPHRGLNLPDRDAYLPASGSNIGPRASKRGGCLLMNDVLPNWTAAGRFKEACEAADAARDAGITHKEAVCEALRLTLCLVEDWRGDHRQEIADYLGTNAPKEGQDDVLAIVKHVFARQDKKQWNWHANALRQAIAENRTSDEVKAYF